MPERISELLNRHAVEVGWWAFVLANVWGMLTFGEWATVPFHFIWIGLALVYGWRVWTLRVTTWSVAAVISLTGAALVIQVRAGGQQPDELTEIPLMAMVFVAMVIYVRRAVAAKDQTEQVSQKHLALLRQETRFVQDASHMLRTPLTVALGHAELLRSSVTEAESAADLRVVIDELNRLRKITDQLLSLASTKNPNLVNRVGTDVAELVRTVLVRWTRPEPRVRVGSLWPGYIMVDRERIRDALEELIRNALVHAPEDSPVEVSSHRVDGHLRISVTDHGPGISAEDQATVFDRWAKLPAGESNGVGLGLAIVKSIAEAHGGSVEVCSTAGHGSTFSIVLPAVEARADGSAGSNGAYAGQRGGDGDGDAGLDTTATVGG